jgi:hypothetical protein
VNPNGPRCDLQADCVVLEQSFGMKAERQEHQTILRKADRYYDGIVTRDVSATWLDMSIARPSRAARSTSAWRKAPMNWHGGARLRSK